MALKTFVKVSAVNNLSDARYCAGMEVDLIGFNIEKDKPGYISPENFRELTEWLSGPGYVAEFESYSAVDITDAVKEYDVDYVEISDMAVLGTLSHTTLPVIFRQNRNEMAQLPFDLNIKYLLITGGDDPLSKEEIEIINNLSAHYDVLLEAGITHENVEAILQHTNAKGIALQGGNELRPGYKDYDELADILEALEVDDMV
ncbi:hypothetical protein C900_01223 [Fulvivirga imtechensis AK7]|uniref:Phosphoribosylanthranilate isomerase n=1 Tax=Fulvivirga imtechensis AK7 TaxID=1237149 RepID=L8JY27_9BACT|nr:hypothetical protein [Fulvivirga imtechensis]ELR72549.1 hypothetical protein C900_01223 [Fulvivirga imtechensis AK7]